MQKRKMERERNKITSVCVYCASSTQVASAYREAAAESGIVGRTEPEGDQRGRQFGPDVRRIGCYAGSRRNRNRCDPSFYGGTGLVSQGAYRSGRGRQHARAQATDDLSDAVIALPGGCGTLEELLEVITWKQLGLYLNPIVILI